MEGRDYRMRRVLFLRWYFGFQLNCNVCVINTLFVFSPLSHVGPFSQVELELTDAFKCIPALPVFHCLWGPSRYWSTDNPDVEYYQQGKLHRSDGPAVTRNIIFRPPQTRIYTNSTFSTVEIAGQQIELMHTFYKEGKQVAPF